jgi:hypothetical protein
MWGKLKPILRILLMIPVVLAAALIAESIPLLHAPDAYFADNPGVKTLLISLCVGMAIASCLILVGTQFVVRRSRPEELTEEALGEGVEAEFSPMDRQEVEELIVSNRAVAPSIWSRYAYRLRGSFVGRSFSVEASMRSVIGSVAHRHLAAQPRVAALVHHGVRCDADAVRALRPAGDDRPTAGPGDRSGRNPVRGELHGMGLL